MEKVFIHDTKYYILNTCFGACGSMAEHCIRTRLPELGPLAQW